MNQLLIHTANADKYLQLLQKYELPDLEVVSCANQEEARRAIRSSNIVLGEPTMIAKILSEARCLEWVQSVFAGVEALCVPGLRRDYLLTGVKGIHGPIISEYVLAYILAIERQLFETQKNQNAKEWIEFSYRNLRKLTLGICGLGSIGRHLAQTAHHFGMRVIAFKRTAGEIPYVERVYTGASFGKFLGLPDYLVLVLPATSDTTGLINSETLKNMKPSAILMNVGRGNAIVQADLIQALENRQIRAAVLDVFEEEPLPKASPLWDLPNVFITPHNAGISFPEDILPVFYNNYLYFLEKKPLNFTIDFNRGY